MGKLELLKFGGHIGVYDPVLKKRLKDLIPKKYVNVRVKATAFEKGYATLSLGDIQKKLRNKRLISKLEYRRLLKEGF